MELLYLIQFTAIVLLGLFLYYFGLRELKWFDTSRVLLVFLIPLALVLPLIGSFYKLEVPSNTLVIGLQEIVVTSQNTFIESEVSAKGSFFSFLGQILLSIYIVGIIWQFFKLRQSYFKIIDIRKKSIFLGNEGGTSLYQWEGKVPFTFMNKIFLPIQQEIGDEDREMILKHESCHVSQKHWLDKFWIQLICSFLWFFPPVYWIRAALEEVHEMQADRVVIQSFSRKSYMQLLLRQAMGNDLVTLNFLSPFITLTLKKRIKMIANRTINPAYRLVFSSFCVLLMGAMSSLGLKSELTAMNSADLSAKNPVLSSILDTVPAPSQVAPPPEPRTPPAPQAPPVPEIRGVEANDIFQVVEQMPRFPGCEEVSEDMNERKACADRKMLEFIYENIRYPDLAREDSIQGHVVVTFVVSKEGAIKDPRIVRDIGGGCGEEVLRVMHLMIEMEEPWIPGRQRGRDVNVQLNLPVRFSLN